MTITSDLETIVLTPSAAALAKGHNLEALVSTAQSRVAELKMILAQIVDVHPDNGYDAKNYARLPSLLAKLA